MPFLRIANPGVTDYRALVLLGVSGSRNDDARIGRFGSGSKMGALACMREKIYPVWCVSNLKLEYTTKDEEINGLLYDRVCIKLSGKDENGKQLNRTETTDRTLQASQDDWGDMFMGLREFVANAIDGATENGFTINDVEIDIVENVRAKKGWTCVYIPVTDKVRKFVSQIGNWFLHFSDEYKKEGGVIQKKEAGPAKIYHKGVLIRAIGNNSLFDYDCPELTVDESRNSDEWSCRNAVVSVLSKNQKELQYVLRNTINRTDLFECSLNEYHWKYNTKGKEAIEKAFIEEFGQESVLCDNNTKEHVQKKGLIPISINEAFSSILRTLDGVKKDSNVLKGIELSGLNEEEPTEEVLEISNRVWETFEYLKMTNGKNKPKVMCMWKPMEGDTKVQGLQSNYNNGTIWLDKNLGGIGLVKTVVHEISHHITGDSDGSRGFEDFAFLTIAKMIS